MKNLYLIGLLVFCFLQSNAQLGIPEVEAVYGGRINAITAYKQSTTNYSRIFVSTESANSIFYADLVHGGTTPPTFQVVPALDASANFGSGIQKISSHEATGNLVFAHQTGLFYAKPNYTSVQTIYSGNVETFVIKDSLICFTSGPQLRVGYFNYAGNYVSLGGPYSMATPGGMVEIAVHPITGILYFYYGTSGGLFKSSDPIDAISVTTTYNVVSSLSLTAGVVWQILGIGPDGRIFIGGSGMGNKWIAYTDDEITWTDYNTGVGGVHGKNFAFSGSASTYYVYTAKMYSTNKGTSGTWNTFGNMSFETHPNDGVVCTDPFNDAIVFMTTDQGLGISLDKGANIVEFNDGIEAVQVKDFDMTTDKNTAWLASKSGIRRVTNYLTSPTWTNSIFPNNDGSPYFSAEMNQTDHNTIFVGNVRIYRTTNNGVTWSQVFTPENAPYNFNNVGTEARAIEICNANPNIVMAGFAQTMGSAKGGLFYSENGGNTWSQVLLNASVTGPDVNVYDIEFNLEGTDTVAYVGVEYDLASPAGRSVYKLVKSGFSWIVTQDMNSGTTSTGSLIVATIRDIEVSSTGDTIFAAGTDAGINHPIAYFKPLNATGLWTPFTTSGFPFVAGKQASAFTIGVDTVYCAVDNEIYYHALGSSNWAIGATYPNGTLIEVLYFDDLLAGTGIGLFNMPSDGTVGTTKSTINLTANAKVFPNPARDFIVLEMEIEQYNEVSIRIFDLSGRQIYMKNYGSLGEGKHQFSLSTAQFTNGIYFCKIQIGNTTNTQKLVVSKD